MKETEGKPMSPPSWAINSVPSMFDSLEVKVLYPT